MLNELPTIEQMKNCLYNVYKDWLCPICDDHKETFAHIWECDTHNDILKNIIRELRSHIITLMEQELTKSSLTTSLLQDLHFLCNILYDPDDYIFVDFIIVFINYSLLS